MKPNRTRGLVRRATPFFATGVVIALQAALGIDPVVVFPLYLGIVLLTAVDASRIASLTVAVIAAIGISAPPILTGDGSIAVAVVLLLAAVLVVVAVAVREVVGRIRAEATNAQRSTSIRATCGACTT